MTAQRQKPLAHADRIAMEYKNRHAKARTADAVSAATDVANRFKLRSDGGTARSIKINSSADILKSRSLI